MENAVVQQIRKIQRNEGELHLWATSDFRRVDGKDNEPSRTIPSFRCP